ncbi:MULTISPECIES: Na(+)/H(+) antiporter subunit B [Halanaerobium]|uniref:Membrane bound protein complex subunit mbxF n=1 Tax=Halanaerobium kushneri TaxID=56779 RepID=A0A1N6QP02_9FIRM|nr:MULTISPECIES: Na(+)/H(+) antiporter subunit B [Halanaerobium]RCW61025.1 Membrane bound protein complex subunit mbxF [Halanaerobium sp. ST460_2HS_T2]SIQ18339.1 Membrane bound protein complex subunit mbxF [Halanaerobium kushneri]
MKFRNFLALIIVAVFAFIIFQAFTIVPAAGEITINKFGQADLSNRTASRYINKNVNSDSKKVIYKESSNLESGSANIVTSVVANYRSFDTLGEITVLFLAAAGIAIVLNLEKSEKSRFAAKEASLILNTGIKIIFPLLLLAGAYIFIHGHLSPGGGFQGGAVIATAFLLKMLADYKFEIKEKSITLVESAAGIVFVGLGLYGLITRGSFLENFLATGTVGELFSGGTIAVIYTAIAFKVGAELTNIVKSLIEA